MSGKDLFNAIGQVDEKTAAKNVSRFNKKTPDTESSKTKSNVFSVLKAVAVAASVLLIIGFAIFMRIVSERMKDPPVKPAESEVKTDTDQTKTSDPELSEYNVFVCGDQAVQGLQGMWFCSYYDDQTGAWLNADGFGISYELIHMSDPPTVYRKPGDAVRFIKDPDPELKYNDTFDLWDNKGSSQISYRETETKNPDALYSYLENNPGEYYITVNYYSYGRTVGDQRESFGYTYGVKLVCAGTASSTETQAPETEETEPAFDTAYDHAGYLIKKLAVSDKNTDKSKEMWNTLLSLGGDALDYCADILNKTADDGEKVWMAKLLCVYVKDEISSYGENFMTSAGFVDYDSDDADCRYWYTMFKGTFRSAARKKEKTDVAKDTPVLYRILTRIGFDNYAYYPERHTAEENIERACLIKSLSPLNVYKYTGADSRLCKEDRAQLYEIYKNGDDLHKALVGYTIYNNFRYSCYDINDVFLNGREYFEYIPTGKQQWRQVEFSDVVKSAAESSAWLDTLFAAVKAEAASLCREEFAEYNPVFYGCMEEDGFDGYKPGKPDIAFRAHRALYAATELYWAVEYGYLNDGINEIGLNEFCSYFEKYLEKDIVTAYMRNTEGFYIEGDMVYLWELGPQTGLEIDLRSAHVISQSGNKAVIGVNIGFPNGMFVCDREMTFEVIEDKNGVRVTGGSFVEKVLIPYQNAALTLNYVMETYMVLRQADPRYSDFLAFGTTYYSYEKVPEAYRDLVGENDEFPLFLITSDPLENYWLKKSVSPEILAKLCKATPAFDGSHLYPENVKFKLEPAFKYIYEVEEYEFCLPWFDILRNMKVVKASGGNITAALDFIREENGKKQNVTYTFELKYIAEDDGDFKADSYVLTGGSFVTELIYGK